MSSDNLQVAQVIPNGVYRIKSVNSPTHYLTFVENGRNDVNIATDLTTDIQKWSIKGNTQSDVTNTYSIVNVANGCQLAFRDATSGAAAGQLCAYDTGGLEWTLEPRGNYFIIGWTGNEKCIDLSTSNQIAVMWGRNNLPQQRWILEPAVKQPVLSIIPGSIYTQNLTQIDIEMMLYHYATGDAEYWYTIPAGTGCQWPYPKHTGLLARIKGAPEGAPGTTLGAWVHPGCVVTVVGFDQPLQIRTS